METFELSSWDDFEKEVGKINLQLNSYRKDVYSFVSDPLYRGQRDSHWLLKTTVERYFEAEMTYFEKYRDYLYRVLPAVESLTGTKFEFKYGNGSSNSPLVMKEDGLIKGQYEFMVHLRHNGFPSPLLDWSRSPYVALFFAFQGALEHESVSVYTYVEHLGEGKGGVVGAPEIQTLGPYFNSHKRHFLQQAEYTYCIRKVGQDWVFCSHEHAFDKGIDCKQDMLVKFILPGSIKIEVLKKLDQMNINAFSLFGSEEGLMQMLAFRERNAVKSD